MYDDGVKIWSSLRIRNSQWMWIRISLWIWIRITLRISSTNMLESQIIFEKGLSYMILSILVEQIRLELVEPSENEE